MELVIVSQRPDNGDDRCRGGFLSKTLVLVISSVADWDLHAKPALGLVSSLAFLT